MVLCKESGGWQTCTKGCDLFLHYLMYPFADNDTSIGKNMEIQSPEISMTFYV